jgi:quinol monooxygenase YgiN
MATLHVITHVDVTPPNTAAAEKILAEYAADTRRDAGALRFEVLQEPARRNHFTMVGVWQDQQAFEDHEGAAHTREFRNRIQPLLGGPLDERLHLLFA